MRIGDEDQVLPGTLGTTIWPLIINSLPFTYTHHPARIACLPALSPITITYVFLVVHKYQSIVPCTPVSTPSSCGKRGEGGGRRGGSNHHVFLVVHKYQSINCPLHPCLNPSSGCGKWREEGGGGSSGSNHHVFLVVHKYQ